MKKLDIGRASPAYKAYKRRAVFRESVLGDIEFFLGALEDTDRIHEVDIGASLTEGWVEIKLKLGPRPENNG